MQAISVWQPWAVLLAAGKKCCETRHWPIRHRGPLLIHAAKKWDANIAYLTADPLFRRALGAIGFDITPDERAAKAAWGLPLGAIVGRVDIVDCFPTERVGCVKPDAAPTPMIAPGRKLYVNPTEKAFGDFEPGRFAWVCANPVRFPAPIPCRGAQGLFDVPADLIPEAYRV